MKPIFMSLCVFSIIFAASATLIEDASYTHACIIDLYVSEIICNVLASIPDTIFTIFSKVFTLSPGFILSGLYQIVKSFGQVSPLAFSSKGRHISSVAHGSTVDSYTIICPD
jgi:hypothetical protein